ncbi:LytTR family DNA-binding domain-containing protein [Algoriphagus sp. AGSA1]|uniref:LytR/AlgR family response regulator transcription factor n=1 Tax=Algoriphagus sp. AGSA1 TaxID=2907213 RepID=UPI001F23BB19|nr:LytTR family DNA-binding domain-containing protein [Algoriphagus sp. AGSA1]MCE7053456.1 LytTR family DNA-binding domain-containing protein [Algoriphagus sp. AGSA1]
MMTCMIVDDEPLAREAIQSLVSKVKDLHLLGSFSSANAAAAYLADNSVDLIFLDIQMPGTNGIDFAKTIPSNSLVIFTTAFSEFALDSYEVDALDYLIKPVRFDRFKKAVEKAISHFKLLAADQFGSNIERIAADYFFVRADRRTFKIYFKDIFFIQGLKDYVVLHTGEKKIITAMNIKTIHDQLPSTLFVRTSKSYIINVRHIDSFDNNTVFIQENEIPIGDVYRNYFFEEFVIKKMIGRGQF